MIYSEKDFLSIIPRNYVLSYPFGKKIICNFMNESSGATLLFEHSPSRASEIDHFENFICWRENQLVQQFFLKFNLLLPFLTF